MVILHEVARWIKWQVSRYIFFHVSKSDALFFKYILKYWNKYCLCNVYII